MTLGWLLFAPFLAEPTSHSLTLEQALTRAEANQPALKRAQGGAQIAEAQADLARAALLPQITAVASYRRTTANRVLRAGTSPVVLASQAPPNSQLYDWYNFGVSGSLLIYDFGQTLDQFRSARALSEAQVSAEASTRNDIVLNVRLAFYAARAEKELAEVARQALANQERHQAEVDAFVQARLRPEIDLLQARLGVSNARLAVVQAQNGYDSARAELTHAMGEETNIDYDIVDPPLSTLPFEEQTHQALLADAAKTRPEFAMLAKQIQGQELLLSSARSGYGPALSVSGSVTEAGTEFGRLRWNYYGQVTLSWRLFEGLRTPARVNEAKASLDVARAERDTLRQQIALDLEKARLSLGAAKASLGATADAVENATQRLRLAEARYEAGLGSALEVSDAQLAKVSADVQRVTAEYSLQAARAMLTHAIGRR